MDIQELIKEEDTNVLLAEFIRCVQEVGRKHPEYFEITGEVLLNLERYRLSEHPDYTLAALEHLGKLVAALSQYSFSVKDLCLQHFKESMLVVSPSEPQRLYEEELQSLIAHLELIQRINFCAIKILVTQGEPV